MEKTDFSLLKKYFGPYRNQLVLITLLSIICGFVQAISLGTLAPLINIIATDQEPTGNLWNVLKTTLGFFHLELNLTTLLIVLSAIFVTGQILIFFRQTLQVNLRFKFVKDMKEKLFFNLLKTDLAYHYDKKSGQFLDTILTETERAGSGLFVVTDIFSNLCLIFVYILMLVYISVEMTLYCTIIVTLMFLFVNRLLQKSKVFGIKCVEANAEINEYTTERLNLLKLIKANSTESFETSIFSRIADHFRVVNSVFVINGAKIELLFQSIMFLVAIIIIYLSMIVFHLSVGLILVFLFVLIMMTNPMRSINNQRHELTSMIASLRNVDTTFTNSLSFTRIKDGKIIYTDLKQEIIVRDVSYSYLPGQPVLHHVTLSIKKNQMVALVGPSGGGKSTLVDMLIRHMDPIDGEILIDGRNLREFDVRSYHTKIGIVSQDVFIFHDTILANICYGSESVSLERAKAAAKIAYADEFIEQQPDGYYSMLGDRGVKLSGGQKQRIALARAIYKEPDILILDEATSALDTESEKIIQRSINAIKHQYTIVVVAHRLSTIENADIIYVIEKGSILESGNHDQLLNNNGTYSRYYSMQQAGEKRD